MRNVLFCFFLLISLGHSAQTVVLSEDFESGLPVGWTIRDNDGFTVHPNVSAFQDAWITTEDPSDVANTCAGSTSYFTPEGRASRWLITPSISLSAYGNFLYWRAASHDPSFPDGYMVLLSTTGTEIEDFTDTLFRRIAEFPEWTARSINLSDSGYNDITVHIAFVNNTNRGFKLYLDDIRVEVNDPVSFEEHTLSQLVVYPNPTNDLLHIVSSEEITSIYVYATSGQLVASSISTPLYLDSLENGVYFIHLTTKKGVVVKQIIKD
jgi:hypothetical protein